MPAQRNAPTGRAVVVDLAARRRAKQRQQAPQRPTGYVFGAGDAPRILLLDRQLAERGITAASRLEYVVALPDAEWDALWRDLADHVERGRAA